MRLAVFTNQFPARLSTFFARDMRALLDAGIEIDILPLYPLDASLWAWVPADLGPAALPPRRVHHLSRLAGIALPGAAQRPRLGGFVRDVARVERAAAAYGPEPLVKSAYAALKAWAWFERLGAERYDHVLAYWGNYSATAAYLFHRAAGRSVPFSMFVHARMDLYRKPAFLVEKMLYADTVFLVCDFNRRYLAQHYPADFALLEPKLRTHHIGIDLAAVEFAPGPRPPARLLAVGRLEPLKGYRELLQTVALLAERGRPVELELIGGGPQERELRRLADQLGIAASVRFAGWRKPAEVLAAMRRATLFVHAPVALDAMPTVLKEALAVGTPAIGSDLAGIPEILDGGRCGVLVPPGDVAALAEAIAGLLGAPDRRAELARRGREHASRMFDARSNGARLAEALLATRARM